VFPTCLFPHLPLITASTVLTLLTIEGEFILFGEIGEALAGKQVGLHILHHLVVQLLDPNRHGDVPFLCFITTFGLQAHRDIDIYTDRQSMVLSRLFR
jgi:hypothetical protein